MTADYLLDQLERAAKHLAEIKLDAEQQRRLTAIRETLEQSHYRHAKHCGEYCETCDFYGDYAGCEKARARRTT